MNCLQQYAPLRDGRSMAPGTVLYWGEEAKASAQSDENQQGSQALMHPTEHEECYTGHLSSFSPCSFSIATRWRSRLSLNTHGMRLEDVAYSVSHASAATTFLETIGCECADAWHEAHGGHPECTEETIAVYEHGANGDDLWSILYSHSIVVAA